MKSPNATYYLRGRGYRPEDFERIVSEVAGADMSDFFKRYVRGVESPPYEEALAQVGLRLARESQQPVSIGITADETDTTNLKIARVRPGSAAADDGWDAGDKILSIGGIRITSRNFLKMIGRYKPGDRVSVTLQRGARTIQTTIVLGEPQTMTYRIEEIKDAPSAAKTLRAAWIKG